MIRGQHLVRAHAEQVRNPAAVLSHASAALVGGLPNPGFERWHDQPVSVMFPGGEVLRRFSVGAREGA